MLKILIDSGIFGYFCTRQYPQLSEGLLKEPQYPKKAACPIVGIVALVGGCKHHCFLCKHPFIDGYGWI